MKLEAHLEDIRRERDALARVMALEEDYMVLYTVRPDTGGYVQYTASSDYGSLGIAREGTDFFGQSLANSRKFIHPDDLPEFLRRFNRENVLAEIRDHGIFKLHYRLVINGTPTYVGLKIASLQEDDGERLLVGVRAWRSRQ